MPQISYLSDDSIEKLRADHDQLRLQVERLVHMLRALSAVDAHAPLVIGKTDGSGISAISSDTPGSGTVTLYRLAAGGTSLASTGYDVTCYNMAGQVAASTYVGMMRDDFGRFWAIVENCS